MSIILTFLGEHLIEFIEKELVNAEPMIEEKIKEEVSLLIEKLKTYLGDENAS